MLRKYGVAQYVATDPHADDCPVYSLSRPVSGWHFSERSGGDSPRLTAGRKLQKCNRLLLISSKAYDDTHTILKVHGINGTGVYSLDPHNYNLSDILSYLPNMSAPATMKALVVQAPKVAAVQEVPVPGIADDEILVKVVAAAQNPTDWQRTLIATPFSIFC